LFDEPEGCWMGRLKERWMGRLKEGWMGRLKERWIGARREQPALPRARIRGRSPQAVAGLVVVVVASFAMSVVAATWLRDRYLKSPCERASAGGDQPRTGKVCEASSYSTGRGGELVTEMWAHLQRAEREDEAAAERLAGQLLASTEYPEAHAVLRYLTQKRDELAKSRMHATIARMGHALAGNARGLAADEVGRSQLEFKAGDFAAAASAGYDALARLTDARLIASRPTAARLSESHLWMTASVATVDALRRLGEAGEAEKVLARASDQVTDRCDSMWLHVKHGLLLVEEEEPTAEGELALAERANQTCNARAVSLQVASNIIQVLRNRGATSKAWAALDQLAALTGVTFEERFQRGLVATDRHAAGIPGAADEAASLFAEAARHEPDDADWQWTLDRARGELSEIRGHDEEAEQFYRRAIDEVAALRGSADGRFPGFVASHRGAHDDLIALLARQQRWRAALEVILDLDASDMLRATSERNPLGKHRDLDLPQAAPVRRRPALDEVLAAWRGADLVVVIAPQRWSIAWPPPDHVSAARAHERAYRLRVVDGEVTGADVGFAPEVLERAARLAGHPADRAAAQALGKIFVPAGPCGDTLHVLAVGALGAVPTAALRDADGSLSSVRCAPARVLGLFSRGAASAGLGSPVVLANPTGDLPMADLEGIVVTAALGAGAERFGAMATRPATLASLWAARDARVLHVAGHVTGAHALHLADGDATPEDLARHHVAPRIAVLAACGSGAARDEEGWGSVAAALITGGTSAVIATERNVDDTAVQDMMRRLYALPDWSSRPARALAQVQQALDAKPAVEADNSVTSEPRVTSDKNEPSDKNVMIGKSLTSDNGVPSGKSATGDKNTTGNSVTGGKSVTSARSDTWSAFFVLARPPVIADTVATAPH
jgi:hypothetical protein